MSTSQVAEDRAMNNREEIKVMIEF